MKRRKRNKKWCYILISKVKSENTLKYKNKIKIWNHLEPVGGQCMKYNEGIPWVWTQPSAY